MPERHDIDSAIVYTKRPNDRLFAHPRHAGESRYPRPAFVGAKKDVDTVLRRHDGGAAPMGQSLGPLVLDRWDAEGIPRYAWYEDAATSAAEWVVERAKSWCGNEVFWGDPLRR